MELLIIRHGESEWNAEGRWQGQADPALSELGLEQAAQAAGRLTGAGVEAVITSDLRRAHRTAEILAEALGLGPPALVPGLREVDVGLWTGLSRAEVESGWPGQPALWTKGKLASTPGGETLADLRRRVTATVTELLGEIRRQPGPPATVLVVSHRRAISALEEASGVRPSRAGNLAGRRFLSPRPGELLPADPLDLLGRVGEPARSRPRA